MGLCRAGENSAAGAGQRLAAHLAWGRGARAAHGGEQHVHCELLGWSQPGHMLAAREVLFCKSRTGKSRLAL